MRHTSTLLLGLLFALSFSGCAADSQPSPAKRLDSRAPETALALAGLAGTGLPSLAELDALALPPGRQASADNILDGSAFLTASPGAVPSGSSVVLSAGASFEWAVYAFDPAGAQLLQVTVNQTNEAGQDYLAFPDYETGRWLLSQPVSGSAGGNLDYPGATNDSGVTYCAVVVPAGSSATVSSVNFITDDTPAPGPVTVDSDGSTGWFLRLAIVSGRPAIAYTDFGDSDGADGDLNYVIADDAQGTTWGTPVQVDTDGDTGHDANLLVVNGNPAIAYQNFDLDTLKYVRATDTTGTSWGSPVTVDSSGSVGHFPHMEIVNGRPAIVQLNWPDSLEPAVLNFIRAADADGTGWGSPVEVAQLSNPDDISDNWSLAIVAGNPAVAYADENAGALNYKRATDADGSSWGAAVPISAGLAQWNSLLVDGDGRPCVAFYESTGGPASGTGQLFYSRGADSTGSSFAAPVLVDAAADTGFFNDAILFNGKPVIAYYSLTDGALRMALAADTAATTWSDLRTLDTAGDTGAFPSLQPLGDGSSLGVAYHDVANGDLRFLGGIN